MPGELLTSLVGQDGSGDDNLEVSLQSGIPIYDRETEEVFGCIVATRDIYQMLQQQLGGSHSAGEIIIASDTYNIMSHKIDGRPDESTRGQKVAEVAPVFASAMEHLQKDLDFVDDVKAETYGARIWLDSNQNGLMFLLKL